jgi:MULE transposase-like protein
MNSSCSI